MMSNIGIETGSTGIPEDRCPTCGSALKPAEGVASEWNGRTIRFRCLGCLARFEADPDRYLAGDTEPCGADDGPAARLDLAKLRDLIGDKHPAILTHESPQD